MKKISIRFIRNKYPSIELIDVMNLAAIMSTYMRDYEYDFKKVRSKPSTLGYHPFIFKITDDTKSEILKNISDREKEYINFINKFYSNIPLQ